MRFRTKRQSGPSSTAAGGWTAENEIRLYDFASGKLVALLKGHTNVTHSLAFSPDSKTLLTSALNGLREATLLDRWDPEPFKWKALVLIESKAPNDEYVEALAHLHALWHAGSVERRCGPDAVYRFVRA